MKIARIPLGTEERDSDGSPLGHFLNPANVEALQLWIGNAGEPPFLKPGTAIRMVSGETYRTRLDRHAVVRLLRLAD